MFSACRFVLYDDITINPIDMIPEKKPAAEKLYEKAIEAVARREEEFKRKRIQELRDQAVDMRSTPFVSEASRALSKGPSHAKHFYEYNQDWKAKVEKKMQMEREEKQAKLILEAEEKKMRLKEHYASYQREKEKLDAERKKLRTVDQFGGHGKQCPSPPPEPSNPNLNSAFKPAISEFAKQLKRDGKVEDRLLLLLEEKNLKEEEKKLEALEKELDEKLKAKKQASKQDPKALYDRSIKYLQEKQAKVQKINSKVSKDLTFKPQTNKLSSRMEQKVNEMRRNYNLEKDHSKTPIKELNRERVKKEAAESRKRVQEFIERNNYAQQQKEIHLEQLKREFGAALIESIQQPQYQSAKQSEALLKESEKYKDKDLWERQKLFMEEKEEKLKNLKKEAEDDQALENFRFHKETNKKALNSRATGSKDLNQSAKTAQVGRDSQVKEEDSCRRDLSPDIAVDSSQLFIGGQEGIEEILFKFRGEATPDVKRDSREYSDYRLTPDDKQETKAKGEEEGI